MPWWPYGVPDYPLPTRRLNISLLQRPPMIACAGDPAREQSGLPPPVSRTCRAGRGL
jgi:hypothetical protein